MTPIAAPVMPFVDEAAVLSCARTRSGPPWIDGTAKAHCGCDEPMAEL
jgi:hypothetical protein